VRWSRPSRRRQTPHDGLAHAFGAARDESPLAGEFGGIEGKLRLLSHQTISLMS